MRAVSAMLKVQHGTLSLVADRPTDQESLSETYPFSGTYGLVVKLYVDNFDDLSRLPSNYIQKIPHIRETFTLLAFPVFE